MNFVFRRFLNTITLKEQEIINKIINNEAYIKHIDKSGFYTFIKTRTEKIEYINKILNKEVYINNKQNLMFIKKMK